MLEVPFSKLVWETAKHNLIQLNILGRILLRSPRPRVTFCICVLIKEKIWETFY
jgi:hypothetical protein